MSGAAPEEDINSKFQRLLQEYQKVKKQNTILKEAVIKVFSIINLNKNE